MKKNILFMWMPKCAGVSIHENLRNLIGQRYYGDYNNQNPRIVFNPNVRCATFYHSHIPSLIEAGFLPQSWVDDAYKFAFVRNPWDRMVSLYHYLKNDDPKKYTMSFQEWLLGVFEGNYPKPEKRNMAGYYQANTLLDWLRPKGVWLPDFIGRFENLQADWNLVCDRIGFPPEYRYELYIRNPSVHTKYQDYYTPALREQLAKHFAEEIATFGYRYEVCR